MPYLRKKIIEGFDFEIVVSLVSFSVSIAKWKGSWDSQEDSYMQQICFLIY